MNFEKQVGNYVFQMQSILGHGSYGTVYFGKHVHTKVAVAIKVIDSRRMDQTSRQQLRTEIESMRNLDNPNVVKLLDVYQTTKNIYIISEFCQGGDLRELIGKLNSQKSINIIQQILNGYRELFKNKIIHRDLKPANILLHNNVVKIADFGFAKKVDDSEELMNSVAGTPLYMAPQVLRRESYTSKCDIWSIGMILYELLFQHPPFNAQNIIELVNEISTRKIFIDQKRVDQPTKNFLEGCLQLKESDRFGWEQVYGHEIFRQSPQMQNPSTHSYQSLLISNYFEMEFRRNFLKIQTHLNFMKFLFNIILFTQDQELLYYAIRRVTAMSRNMSQECWNWLGIVEIKRFSQTQLGKEANALISQVCHLFQEKFGDITIQVSTISLNDIQLEYEIQKYQQQIIQYLKGLDPSQNLYSEYMKLQVISVLSKELQCGFDSLLDIVIEDIQFVQGLPEEDVRQRIYTLQQI